MKKILAVLLFFNVGVMAETERDQFLADLNARIKADPGDLDAWQLRGEEHFRRANFKASVQDFDTYLKARPRAVPYHWQRGLSHFYAGMYEAGVKQFEVHRTVNPNDVENSVWHYLCLAKFKDVETARKQFIPTGGDGRVPMMQIHALFAGKMTPEEVLAAVEKSSIRRDRFYAHLYLGLYYHIHDKPELEKKHITLATTDYSMPGYMGDTARAHEIWLKKKN